MVGAYYFLGGRLILFSSNSDRCPMFIGSTYKDYFFAFQS